MTPKFLLLEEVFAIHADQLARYGGQAGVRDEGLLRSALAQPEASYDSAFLHPTLPEMAAAYLFHIVKNHPFVDGNKRTGLVCALARSTSCSSTEHPSRQIQMSLPTLCLP